MSLPAFLFLMIFPPITATIISFVVERIKTEKERKELGW